MKHFQDIEQIIHFKTTRDRTPTDRPLVPAYRVGEPFRRGRAAWPEGAQFSYSPAGHELTLFYADVCDEVVDEVRRGQAEFALIVEAPVIVLAYRFGSSIPWKDVPYSWHMQPVNWRVVPAVDRSPETRALLWVSLVSSEDGVIRAQRGLTLSPVFTRVLHEAIRAQAKMPFDPARCTSVISKIFLSHPSTVDRLTLATAQTMGNE